MSAYAIAANEQNAAGDRVVTAPTNGAARVVSAVLYHALGPDAEAAAVAEFLLTATVVGLIKLNASISGAEGGCQTTLALASAVV